MLQESLTHDEASFLAYGRQILTQKTAVRQEPFHNSKMPVNALQALPQTLWEAWGWDKPLCLAGREIPYGEYRWWLSRGVTVAFGVLLLGIVACWSFLWYGREGSVLSLALAAFCPTLLGHAHYVTADAPNAAMMLLAMFVFWKFCARPLPRNLLAAAVAAGLAQASKYTAVLLLGLYGAAGAGTVLAKAGCSVRAAGQWLRQRGKALAGGAAGFLLLMLIVMNTCFLWEAPMTSVKDYGDKLANMMPQELQAWRLPTAYGWLQGLALTMGYEHHLDRSPGRPYFLGKAEYRRWFLYYPVAFALKMPLAFWGLLALALWRRRVSADEFLFLIFPAMAIFLYFMICQRLQIGMRFLMPVLPFLYVFLGRVTGACPAPPSKAVHGAALGLMAWFIASSLSYHPHPVSYFNELIGSRVNAYRYLADSNLDWGQSQKDLDRYVKEHAGETVHVNPPGPVEGKILVGVNYLVGIYDPEQYRWLREKYRPSGHVGYSWLIFEPPKEQR